MIVVGGKIGGELLEISLGNRFGDPQEFFPDWHRPPLGSAGRVSVPFSGWCHVAIIMKSNHGNKVAGAVRVRGSAGPFRASTEI
jgi:hypothetical protein